MIVYLFASYIKAPVNLVKYIANDAARLAHNATVYLSNCCSELTESNNLPSIAGQKHSDELDVLENNNEEWQVVCVGDIPDH